MTRGARRILAAIVIAASARGTADAQWHLRSNPAVDLWYHGLAMMQYEGPGPLAFYSTTYVAEVRADKARRSMRTLLDREASALGDAFRRDSTFESLHFLPLYFPGEWPERLLALVRAVSGGDLEAGQGVAAGLRSADLARVSALQRVFASHDQRQLLRRLADALEDEWRLYLRDAQHRDSAAAAAQLEAARAFWAAEGAALVRPRPRGGTILLVPSLGAEGRVVRAADTAIVAVQLPRGDTTGRIASLSALRELCVAQPPGMGNPAAGSTAARHAASAASSRDASRCGAEMLAHRPDLAAAYRVLFHEGLNTRR